MTNIHFRNLQEGHAWVQSNKVLWAPPRIVLLDGPMGAGKTQMVSWILQTLGSKQAASPTFAVHHRYGLQTFPVDHFDLYRLTSDADLESTGFWDILKESDNLILIEWAGRLPADVYPLSRPLTQMTLALQGAEERVLSLTHLR